MFMNVLFVGLLSTSGVVPDGDATWTLQLSTDITQAQAPGGVDYSRGEGWLVVPKEAEEVGDVQSQTSRNFLMNHENGDVAITIDRKLAPNCDDDLKNEWKHWEKNGHSESAKAEQRESALGAGILSESRSRNGNPMSLYISCVPGAMVFLGVSKKHGHIDDSSKAVLDTLVASIRESPTG